MKKKIAVPIENGKLCSHFGHCEYFYVATVNDGKIELEQDITPPAHEPGLYPKWVGDLRPDRNDEGKRRRGRLHNRGRGLVWASLPGAHGPRRRDGRGRTAAGGDG